eukprot:TRINITY_DN8646_c0_g2_i1.p1 TRINITY_DN8646_c0_g2~~TRINITY_DN8646_c0_g2_i1.p1  ORF type:complete len:357 (+),score=52.62 TRINITY_DN8646_c0_g2_i1:350-1420(+)
MQQSEKNPLQDVPRWEYLRSLNTGAFGFVELYKDKKDTRNSQVAVKFITRGSKITKYVEREILNHRQLLHPHIIQYKEVFLTDKYLSIVMEYAPGGDMFEYVVKKGGLKEEEARWFFQQLIIAVDYCHRMGVISRDIKLENTLLDHSPRPLLKLCDFGYSKHEYYHSAASSRVGTPAYLAPEVILSTGPRTYDGKMSDVWSCGVMLYVMLVGAYPFERPEDKKNKNSQEKLHKMIQRILSVDYEIPSKVQVSPECRDLLAKILVKEPKNRFYIRDITSHPWFREKLPDKVLEMNEKLIAAAHSGRHPFVTQPVEEIQRILTEAHIVPNQISSADDPDAVVDQQIKDGDVSMELQQR